MPKIEIYSKDYCPYCDKAKNLFTMKGVSYTEIDLSKEPQRLTEMLDRSEGRRTVPQIFIDGKAYGGFDDIYALDEKGALDALIGK